MDLQKLPFDEALYQSFNFLRVLEQSVPENLVENEKQAIKTVVHILANLVVLHSKGVSQCK